MKPMIAKLSCLTVVSLLAGVSFAETFRIVPKPGEEAQIIPHFDWPRVYEN